MKGRRYPTVLGIAACLLVVYSTVLSGCANWDPSASYPGRGPGQNENRVYFEIQSTSRAVATIYINGEERGDTPVHIRAEADPATGGVAEDLVIRAVWDGGSNETEFTISRGSRPQPIVRVGPAGQREY